MTSYMVIFHDGDTITNRMNATPEEVRAYFQVGTWRNVGSGPHDCYKRITNALIENGGDRDGESNL